VRRRPRRPVVAGLLGAALVLASVAGAAAQHNCRTEADAWRNLYEAERIRHQNLLTQLKNQKDQILAEQHVAHNNCARGDNACHRNVRETFAPRLTAIRNNETLENSRHRQEERILGQVRRECRFDDRVEQRKKTQ
jgi:hypothetical protein